MSEQTVQLILFLAITLLGGGGTFSALYLGNKRVQTKIKPLEILYQELNTKYVKALEKIDELEKSIEGYRAADASSKLQTASLEGKVELLSKQLSDEKTQARAERDEIVSERGKTQAKLEAVTNELTELRTQLSEVRNRNRELEQTNRELATYKENCAKVAREKDQAESELAKAHTRIERLEELVVTLNRPHAESTGEDA